MSYSKPQVTIDLEEYNDLQSRIAQFDKDDQVIMAKQIVFKVIEAISKRGSRSDVMSFLDSMRLDGIVVSVADKGAVSRVYGDHRDVIIKRVGK